jgi:hypothetical protein
MLHVDNGKMLISELLLLQMLPLNEDTAGVEPRTQRFNEFHQFNSSEIRLHLPPTPPHTRPPKSAPPVARSNAN